jgi:hypothetical protein
MGNDHAGGSAYEDLYPYYAELCALSELRKKPGHGVKLQSGMGGHAVLYLNGVERDGAATRLRLAAQNPAAHGAGISVNSHYANANWIAIEGRDFLWRGALAADEPVTEDAYARTQAQAKAQGCLDGIIFHKSFFADKPAAMSDEDFMYEISIASDYGLQFGRDSYCARIPLDRPRMEALIAYLNALNEPYRQGKIYRWNIFNDNCVHAARNALAAAGVWKPWPTGQLYALAAFHFPVPKNAIVDLWRRGNELPLEDAQALYEDASARAALLQHGALPTGPGALARRNAAIAANEIYDVEKLKLIFYDNPVWSPYRPHFRRMFASPHFTDLRENLRHFSARYDAARHRPRPLHLSGARAEFQFHYEAHLARAAASTHALLSRLEHAA